MGPRGFIGKQIGLSQQGASTKYAEKLIFFLSSRIGYECAITDELGRFGLFLMVWKCCDVDQEFDRSNLLTRMIRSS